MPEIVIQPTAKFLKAGTIAAALVFVALDVLYLIEWRSRIDRDWLMILPALILLWPLKGWMRRSMMKTTITGDRLRYETGLTSRSTRTIQLAKVQDVRVDQSLGQRIFGVGNISIETAGEASRLTLSNIDSPQALADDILNRSHAASASSGV